MTRVIISDKDHFQWKLVTTTKNTCEPKGLNQSTRRRSSYIRENGGQRTFGSVNIRKPS